MVIFKNHRLILGLFSFLILASICPNFAMASMNSNLPESVTAKLYWTTTITVNDTVIQKLEFLYQNQGNSTVRFNSSIAIQTGKIKTPFFTMPNGTKMLLYLDYDPELKNKYFIQTPKLELEIEKNKIEFFDITYINPNGLFIYNNDTRQIIISSGAEEYVDYWQYKLKIQKRTDLWSLITFTNIHTIKSQPENPPLNEEQDYQVMVWEKSKEIPSVQINYIYEYAKDWNQIIIFLISIGMFGFAIGFIIKILKKKFRKNKILCFLNRFF